MKKIIRILGISLLSIVLLMAIVPVAFKGKIKEIVIAEGNKMLNAEFDFGGLDISLIRDFPKASVTIEDFYLKAFDCDKVVDTTGAGDSFIGGYCTALCDGKSIDDAIHFASAVSAITVSRAGASVSIPTRDEVEEFLKTR